MLFMCLMQSLPALGLPELMQPSRVCIFFCYSLGLVWALNADAFLYLVFGWIKRQEISHIFSGAMLAIVSVAALLFGFFRALSNVYTGFAPLVALKLPSSLYNMLPYIISLVVLAFITQKSRAPKAEGIPYDKGQR